jgi:hypothetical protein
MDCFHLHKLYRMKADITSQTNRKSIHGPWLQHSFWGRGRIRIKLHLILQAQGSYLHSAICFPNTPACAIAENEEGTLHKLELFRSRVEPSLWAMKDGWIVMQREYRDRSYDLGKIVCPGGLHISSNSSFDSRLP